jgi:hypothetical protein
MLKVNLMNKLWEVNQIKAGISKKNRGPNGITNLKLMVVDVEPITAGKRYPVLTHTKGILKPTGITFRNSYQKNGKLSLPKRGYY